MKQNQTGDMDLIWSLILLLVVGGLTSAAPLRKTSKMEVKAAPQEEVNVLMFGVIQFSESLNHVYKKTEAKMAGISQSVRRWEETLERLRRQTQEAAEVEGQITQVIHLLQAQMDQQQAQTRRTKDWLDGMEQEELQLRSKVKKLEMFLNTNMSIRKLQERAEEQSNILRGLQDLTQFQQENIQTQDEKLSRLQEMSEAMR